MSDKITIDEITIDGKLYYLKPPYKAVVSRMDGDYLAEGDYSLYNLCQTLKGLQKSVKYDLEWVYKSYVLCDIETLTKDAVKLRHDLIERFGFWLEGHGYLHKSGV